jgi:hypothetical protein
MISPISSQNLTIPLQSTPKTVKTNDTTAASTSSSADSPVKESSESAFTESRETAAMKNAEAMRTLVGKETSQLQSASFQNIVSPQQALKAYQNSATTGQSGMWTGGS